MSASIAAVVLAGGPPDEVAALVPGAPNKAFVPIAGMTLVERTLTALRATPGIGRMIVVAPLTTHARPELSAADERRAAGATMTESLRLGLAGMRSDALILIAASDLPVLSCEGVEEFLAIAQHANADVVYSCIERRLHEARFPAISHTWARFGDGTYCGGGLAALRPRVLPALERLLERLGAARKAPLRLAAIFGPATLLRYTLGGLRIADAERRASQLLGVPVAAAPCTHPEIAVNVDRPSDVALAEGLISNA